MAGLREAILLGRAAQYSAAVRKAWISKEAAAEEEVSTDD
jgi:hypothetical protein